MDLQDYYRTGSVRRGLENFLSGCDWFLVSGKDCTQFAPPVRTFPIKRLHEVLGYGPDIFRPVIDNHGVVGVFDIEHANPTNKAELFLPEDSPKFPVHDKFMQQADPIYKFIAKKFGDECIADMTFSGYHFLTFIERGSEVYNKLLSLGLQQRRDNGSPLCLEESLIEQYQFVSETDIKRQKPTRFDDAIVYQMFGRVLEYLCHRIMQDVSDNVPFPITVSDVEPRKAFSLDITQYGDPAYMRIIRSPFSSWDKFRMRPNLEELMRRKGRTEPFVDVIRKYGAFENNNLKFLFACAKDYEKAAAYAANFTGIIPRAGASVLSLVEEYERSELFQFHQDFDEHPVDAAECEQNTGIIDEAFRHFIYKDQQVKENPSLVKHHRDNPSLFAPHNIRLITQLLLEDGYHPREIAGLLGARYLERNGPSNHNANWKKYNPETRANFWARTYAGLELISEKPRNPEFREVEN